MVYQARPGIGADDQSGNPQAIAVLVHDDGRDMIVEAAPIVPGQEYGRILPVGTVHDRVDAARHVRLAVADLAEGMLAVDHVRHDPAYLWQGAVFDGREEVA